MSSEIENITMGAERPVRSPLRTALLLVLGYLCICIPYILFSSAIAAQLAESVADLQKVETYKGLIFIVVTALGLFGFSWILLTIIAHRETEVLYHRDALAVAERKAMAGVFASSAGHDINNLLAILKDGVSRLQRTCGSQPGTCEELNRMERSLADLQQLARRLASEGRKGMPGEYERVNLGALVVEVVDQARQHTSVRHCTIDVTGERNFETRGNPVMIRQMLLNLILNAAQATGPNGHIQVGVQKGPRDVSLEVHDNGPGVPTHMRSVIFEPFFTSKESGTGLGLLSVKVYAAAHSGTVEVLDSPLGGALFRVCLPTGAPSA